VTLVVSEADSQRNRCRIAAASRAIADTQALGSMCNAKRYCTNSCGMRMNEHLLLLTTPIICRLVFLAASRTCAIRWKTCGRCCSAKDEAKETQIEGGLRG
jgi:hypothetical protein